MSEKLKGENMQSDNKKKNHNYLPDGRVTKREMFNYGYCWGGMLPVKKDAAASYLKKMPVYKLYDDSSEGLADGIEDLMSHDGLFGIEMDDWILHLKREIENQLKNWKLKSEWNGFGKGTRFETIVTWFEKVFSQPFYKDDDSIYSKKEPLVLNIQNLNFKLIKNRSDFLKIQLKSNQSLIEKLEFMLYRPVQNGEKWEFYFLYCPDEPSRIMAVNNGKAGSDEIKAVPDILDTTEAVVNQFEERYSLKDVINRMVKEDKAV